MLGLDNLAVALSVALATAQVSTTPAIDLNVSALVEPSPAVDYDKTVLEPLRHAQEARRIKDEQEAAEAARRLQEAEEAARQAKLKALAQVTPRFVITPNASLVAGVIGYSLPGGNCVNTARNHGKWQPGNPISWGTTTNQPFIGAAALFYFNHVAIVVGIYADGSIEVIHENAPGAPHRYYPGQIRGYF